MIRCGGLEAWSGGRSRARAGEARVLLVAMSWSCSGRALGRQAMRHCARARNRAAPRLRPAAGWISRFLAPSMPPQSSRIRAAPLRRALPRPPLPGVAPCPRTWRPERIQKRVSVAWRTRASYGDAIKFVDICADDYAAEENRQIDFETAMGRIHAIRQDGEVLTNIAAFRALYDEVGLGWVYAITNYQPWASILDTVYEFWAKYRLPITGRPSLAEVLEKRRKSKVEGGKSSADERRCRLD